MRFPNFFILGAPKCGTTSLYYWLKQNPRVFLSEPKEPGFFSPDIAEPLFKTVHQYRKIFTSATAHHIAVGEATTHYLRSREAVRRILRHQPDARFIVMFRTPLEMAPSLHAQERYNLHENIRSFEVAWRAQEDRRRGVRVPRACPSPELLQYADACKLGEQLERLYRTVDTERVLTIFLEDIEHSPVGVYRKASEFLGIPADSLPEFEVENRRRTHHSRQLHRALRAMGNLKRVLGVPRLRTGLLEPIHRCNAKPLESKQLEGEIRQELLDFFRHDVRKLSELTGRDLSHWME